MMGEGGGRIARTKNRGVGRGFIGQKTMLRGAYFFVAVFLAAIFLRLL
jgi:hypothetical protein